MSEVKLQTGPYIFEVLASVCHSPLEALEQFVENGADAIEQAGIADGCIRIHLDSNHQGQSPLIVVEDNGIGMSPEKMCEVAQRIGDSEKVGHILRGEKGIGLLSFATVANELHLCSRNAHDGPASCLVLRKEWLREGRAQVISSCPQHPQIRKGARAYLMGVLPEATPQLLRVRLRRHLGREFAEDLRRNLYTLLIGDKHGYEPIKPRQFQGIPVLATNLDLGPHGRASVELYALPLETPEAGVDLFGRGGIRLSTLTTLEEFQREPWLQQRLEGSVRYDRLQGTADKTAVLQNEAYKALAQALHGLEEQVAQRMEQVAQEYRDSRLVEIMSRVNVFIGRFLRYLETGYLPERPKPSPEAREKAITLKAPPTQITGLTPEIPSQRREYPSYFRANLSLPVSDKASLRTWGDEAGIIQINTLHSDFLVAESNDMRCAWYLFSAWAKQFLLTEYGADPLIMADEMVGLFSQAGPLLNQGALRSRNGPFSLLRQASTRAEAA